MYCRSTNCHQVTNSVSWRQCKSSWKSVPWSRKQDKRITSESNEESASTTITASADRKASARLSCIAATPQSSHTFRRMQVQNHKQQIYSQTKSFKWLLKYSQMHLHLETAKTNCLFLQTGWNRSQSQPLSPKILYSCVHCNWDCLGSGSLRVKYNMGYRCKHASFCTKSC